MVERRARRKPLVLASTQTLLDSLPGDRRRAPPPPPEPVRLKAGVLCFPSSSAGGEFGGLASFVALPASALRRLAVVTGTPPFYCTNCTNIKHHYVGCRVLGSSDVANAQVFRCSHATRGHLTCGRFYHPPCIGAELHPGDLAEAARCRDRVAAGGAFQCPGPHRRH